MSLIKVFEQDVDVNLFLDELALWPEDWKYNTTRQERCPEQIHTESIRLIATYVPSGDYSIENVKNATEICSTTQRAHYPNTMEWLLTRFPEPYNWLQTTAFIRLKPNMPVYPHIDAGEYYVPRDRYHLALQGRYRYTVEDESIDVEPGTLFWFDNKRMHSSLNLLDEDRIALVFDVWHYELPDNDTVRR